MTDSSCTKSSIGGVVERVWTDRQFAIRRLLVLCHERILDTITKRYIGELDYEGSLAE